MAVPTWFPIRLKFLVLSLFITTAVLVVITFTMASMFHDDKEVYIRDLASVSAQTTADQARSLLSGYRERLQVYSRLMVERDLTVEQKNRLLGRLFEDFRELVAVTLYVDGKEQATLADARSLAAVGLTKGDLARYRLSHPLPAERLKPGEVYVENSTLSEKMPAMTMAVSQAAEKGEKPVVVAAVLRLDSLIRLISGASVFERFLVDDQGILLAHPEVQRVSRRSKAEWIPTLTELAGGQAAGGAVEYKRNGVAMIGGFARVERAGMLAGAQVPKSAAYLASRSLLRNLVIVSLGLLLFSAVLGVFASRQITRNLEELSRSAREVGHGRFDVKVEVDARDEIGELAASFNDMASELNTREKALKEAQAQLIQTEKLAAFGQLGAGIAHEVKNPLAGILGYVQLSLRKTEPETVLHNNLKIIERETKRCRTIIDNLLKFARQEKVERKPLGVNQVVEDTAALVDHQLGMHGIRLEKELAQDLPAILGNGNQLQQILLNLLLNAQQAMEGTGGKIRITTGRTGDGRAEVRISDTGPGIPKEIQARLFEPFFTTKPAGKGTGLGLSVTYGIVKDHKGEILVESDAGRGATFILLFPPVPEGWIGNGNGKKNGNGNGNGESETRSANG
jgi:signal transduction histidine kinase